MFVLATRPSPATCLVMCLANVYRDAAQIPSAIPVVIAAAIEEAIVVAIEEAIVAAIEEAMSLNLRCSGSVYDFRLASMLLPVVCFGSEHHCFRK